MENHQPPAETSLLGLGLAWTRIGYVVLALATTAFLMTLLLRPVAYGPATMLPPDATYKLISNDPQMKVYLRGTPLAALSVFLLVFSALAGLAWTLADVFDRRKRFVWLLPMFVCPLIMGLHALPLALYIFFGRETPNADESVK